MRVITRHLTSQIILSTSLVLMALIGLFLFFDLVNQVDKSVRAMACCRLWRLPGSPFRRISMK